MRSRSDSVGGFAPAARPGAGCVFDAAAAAVGVNGSRADGFDVVAHVPGDVDDIAPGDVGAAEASTTAGSCPALGGPALNVPGGVVATSSGGIDAPDSVSIGRPARPRRNASRN